MRALALHSAIIMVVAVGYSPRSAASAPQFAAAGAGACDAPSDRPLSVLFIGNSFTLGGPLPTVFAKVAASAGWPEPVTAIAAVGGKDLTYHRARAQTVAAVDKGGWDFVVVQEYSTKPTTAGKPAVFKADATWFYDRIKAASPNARVVLYETWAYHPDNTVFPGTWTAPKVMQAQLREHYRDAYERYIRDNAGSAAKTDLRLAPVGDAWERHLAEDDSIRLHASDRKHQNEAGMMLNALVMYATMYGCATTGLPPQLGLSEVEASRLEYTVDAMLMLGAARADVEPPTLRVPGSIELATLGGASAMVNVTVVDGALVIDVEASDADIRVNHLESTSELWLDDGIEVVVGETRYVVNARGVIQQSVWDGARWTSPLASDAIADATVDATSYGLTLTLPAPTESSRFALALNDIVGTTRTRNAWGSGDFNDALTPDAWGTLELTSTLESADDASVADAGSWSEDPLATSVTGCAALDTSVAWLAFIVVMRPLRRRWAQRHE